MRIYKLLPHFPASRMARLAGGLIFMGTLISIGVIGYELIEDYSLVDSFYMTIIGITTVGYGEVKPLSQNGKLFTSILLLFGVGTVLYTIGVFTETLVEGDMNRLLGRRRMDKDINKLEGHYIVCGYGRIGRLIHEELVARRLEVVIVEQDPANIADLNQNEILYCTGDATDDDILESTGVANAKGLFAALNNDAANLFVTLSARRLNANLNIVARAEDESSEIKLKQVGANFVVAPSRAGGHRMAQAMLHPAATDFVDLATKQTNLELELIEISIPTDAKLDGVTFLEIYDKDTHGLIIVAVKKATGIMQFKPPASYEIEKGDILIVLGTAHAITDLTNAYEQSLVKNT